MDRCGNQFLRDCSIIQSCGGEPFSQGAQGLHLLMHIKIAIVHSVALEIIPHPPSL